MATIERDFGLKADEQGFLLGVKKLGQDVAQIDTNVERILDILGNHAPVKDFKQALHQSKLTQNTDKIADNSADLLQSQKQVVTLLSSLSQGQTVINNAQGQNEQNNGQQSQIISAGHSSSNNANVDANNTQSPLPQQTGEQNTDGQSPQIINNERQRDSRGRFVGTGEDEKKGFLGKIVQAIKNGFSSDTSSIDPSIEAMREVGQVLEPVGKVAEFTLRPFGFRSKEKNKPLSRDEEKHNKGVIKLLKKIVSLLSGGAGAGNGGDSGSGGLGSGLAGGLLGGLLSRGGGLLKGAGGLLGGLLKKGLGGLGGLLKFGKGIPLIGTALSALTLSDWDKQNTEQRGESVGSISGGVIGGALGSVLGPVGTMAGAAIGSWVGSKLGGIVAPKISEWTDSLIKADIPKRISNAWDTFTGGLSDYFKEKINNIKENTKELVNDAKDTVGSVGDFAAYQTDRLLAKLGNKEAIERLAQRDRGEIGFTPQNYKAKTTNNTSLGQVAADTGQALTTQPQTNSQGIKRIVSANDGKGSNTLELNDGSIVKRTGDRNWRNNNPGNIRYTELAVKYGAIGSDGEFAIFPTMEMGERAKERLIFESNAGKQLSTKGDYGAGKGYKDKTLTQAIAAYAPGEDKNNTAQYQQAVLSAVGGKNVKMSEYTKEERVLIQKAISRQEGFRVGKVQTLQASTNQVAETQQAQKPTTQTAVLSTQTPVINTLTAAPLALALPQVQAPAFSLMRPTQQVEVKPSVISQTQHKIAAPQIPKPESVKEPIGTPSPMMVRNVDNGQQITQNLSDRHLAHLVTGGLGMTDRWIR